MRWSHYVLVGALILAAAVPASAGIFNRRKKPEPAQRVPELVEILKADRDDRKRVLAAEELRQFDPNQFPQIVPVLVDALQTDPKPAVRSEAAHSLGKLRPVTVPAGQALEKAAAHDSSLRVRLQARTSLMFYNMAGYGNVKKGEPPPAQALKPNAVEPSPTQALRPSPAQPPTAQRPSTAEPPLAARQPAPSPFGGPSPSTSVPVVTAPPGPSAYRPLPSGPSQTPVAPPAPQSVSDEGPMLMSPPQ